MSREQQIATDALTAVLADACQQLDIKLADNVQQQLIRYVQLLYKWNKAYNLTAVRDPLEMVSRHVVDSLSILPWLQGRRCIDVGTGPGLPGLVLAIAEGGARQWTLLDSNGKKTRFLRQAVLELGLENVEIIQERVEKFQPEAKFDTLTSRAFAELGEMLRLCHHLVVDQEHHKQMGRILAMKGTRAEIELELEAIAAQMAEILGKDTIARIEPLVVPGSRAQRHLVIIEADTAPAA